MRVLWVTQMNVDDATHASLATQQEMQRELAALGWDVRIFALGESARIDTGPIHIIRKTRASRLTYPASVIRWARRMRPDLLLLDQEHLVHAVSIARILRLLPSAVPIVVDYRTLPIWDQASLRDRARVRRFWSAVRWNNRYLDGATTITKPLAGLLVGAGLSPAKLLSVWPSGCRVTAHDRRARSKPQSLVRGIYLGPLVSDRGLEALVEALSFEQAQQRSIAFLGTGPLLPVLERLAHSHGVTDRVAFLGHVPHEDVAAVLREYDFGLSPLPDRECWRVSSPLKQLEYLACGLPVVATRIWAHESVLTHGQDAVLAESSDPASLASAMFAVGELTSRVETRLKCQQRAQAQDWSAVAAQFRTDVGAWIHSRMS